MQPDRLKRREFITLLGGAAAAWPLPARAQQTERMRRIGVLMAVAERDLEAQGYIKAFVQALHELGWAHGRNVQIESRWGGGNLDRIRTYAAELVGLQPNVVLAQTALAVAPLQWETGTVPIVFMQLVDPAESGFVASLARPGRTSRVSLLSSSPPLRNGWRYSRRSRRALAVWQLSSIRRNPRKLRYCAQSRPWLLRLECF